MALALSSLDDTIMREIATSQAQRFGAGVALPKKVKKKVKNKPVRPILCKYCSKEFKLSHTAKQKWIKGGWICPLCKTDMCCMPPTERDLLKLQALYLKDRDREPLGKMYKILRGYAKSILLKKYSIITTEWEQDRVANRAAWYLIEHYFNKATFKIEDSFGGYLKHTLKQAVFDKEEKPSEHISMDMENSESKKIYEIGSSDVNVERFEAENDRNMLLPYIVNFIFGFDEYSKSRYEELMRIIAVRTHLKHGPRAVDKFFQLFDRVGKDAYNNSMQALYDELHDLNNKN